MTKRTCKNCLYFDICQANLPCKHYHSTEPEFEDEILADQERDERELYFRQWNQYITELDDEFNF